MSASAAQRMIRSSAVPMRRSGSGRSHAFTGTNDWQPVFFDIDVREDQRNVELILELRARHGRVWFDRSALLIRRAEAP